MRRSKNLKPIRLLMCVGTLLLLFCLGSIFVFAEIESMQIKGEQTAEGIYNSEVEVEYQATDEVGIQQIELFLNDERVGQNLVSEPYTTVTGSFTLDSERLIKEETEDYSYTLKLVVTNIEGQTQEEERQIKADVSIPELVLSGIQDHAIYQNSRTVKVSLSDKNLEQAQFEVIVKRDSDVIAQEVIRNGNYKFEANEEGTYTIHAIAKDKGEHTVEMERTFQIDSSRPEIKQVAVTGHKKDGYSWYDDSVQISADLTDGQSGLKQMEIQINGNPYKKESYQNEKESHIEVPIPKTWIQEHSSKNGSYSVQIQVVDAAGNISKETCSFQADVTDPSVSVSGIDEGAFTNAMPMIKIENLDDYAQEGSIHIEIKKDNVIMDAYERKGSSVNITIKHDGIYCISAYAVDAAGNRSKTQTRTFTKDTGKPLLSKIRIEGHRKEGYSWYDDSVMIQTNASDSLSKLSNITLFVNGKKLSSEHLKGETEKILNVRLSKKWFLENESESGSYKITIVAEDRAGNRSETIRTFHADVLAPSVSLSGVENRSYLKTAPEIQAVATDNQAAKGRIELEIQKDKKPYKTIKQDGETASFARFLTDGDYTIVARAVDCAGNRSKEKKLCFTKDTTAPVLHLSGAKEGSYSTGEKQVQISVKEHNYKNMEISAQITKQLDGKSTDIHFGAIRPNRENYTQSKIVQQTGTYAVTLTAQDKAGNVADKKTLQFTIDNEKPIIKISGVQKENGYTSKVEPKIIFQDSYFKEKAITLKRSRGKSIAGITYKDKSSKKGGSRTYVNFPKAAKYDDLYTLTCNVTDKAGNRAKKEVTFAVNRYGSIYEIGKAEKEINHAYLQSLEQDICVTELNVTKLKQKKAEIYCDGEVQGAEIAVRSSRQEGWNRYDYVFDRSLFDQEGVYELNITSRDGTDNFTEYKKEKGEFRFFIDRTAPSISVSGIEENGRYKTAKATVSVTDAIQLSDYQVTCNGKKLYKGTKNTPSTEVSIPSGYGQTIVITATDEAGNQSSAEIQHVTVSGSFLVRLWANKPLCIGITMGILLIAGGIIFIIRRVRRKQDTGAA